MREFQRPTADQVKGEPPGLVLDCWAGLVCRGLPGLGYYGPTRAGGSHLDYERFDTAEAARDRYREHWPEGRHGRADWTDYDGRPLWWQAGWGPRSVDEVSDTDWEALGLVRSLLVTNPAHPFALERSPAGTWYSRFGHAERAEGDTIPLAVTRACLLAVLAGDAATGGDNG